MKTSPRRGSHLPVLMKLLPITNGSILELGSGMYSTPYLHWACYPSKRKLVTYEDHPDWWKFTKQFESYFHSVNFVNDWNSIDISENFSIAFVDHDPINKRKRAEDVSRLTNSDYVVCHDAENSSDRKYRYSTVYDLFKYRWKYTGGRVPYTMVFSNKHDLSGISI